MTATEQGEVANFNASPAAQLQALLAYVTALNATLTKGPLDKAVVLLQNAINADGTLILLCQICPMPRWSLNSSRPPARSRPRRPHRHRRGERDPYGVRRPST